MKNIQEDIKTGNFKQAYLLYGEEAYLKQQYKHKLVQALNPEDDTMNFNHYEGRNVGWFCWKIPAFLRINVMNWLII